MNVIAVASYRHSVNAPNSEGIHPSVKVKFRTVEPHFTQNLYFQ